MRTGAPLAKRAWRQECQHRCRYRRCPRSPPATSRRRLGCRNCLKRYRASEKFRLSRQASALIGPGIDLADRDFDRILCASRCGKAGRHDDRKNREEAPQRPRRIPFHALVPAVRLKGTKFPVLAPSLAVPPKQFPVPLSREFASNEPCNDAEFTVSTVPEAAILQNSL